MKKIVFIFLFSVAGLFWQVIEASDWLVKLEKKYAAIKDLSMDFEKTEKSEFFKKESMVRGKIYLKNPAKFRVESKSEFTVSDGDKLWSYDKENRQVTIKKAGEDSNFFKIFTSLTDKFTISAESEKTVGKVSYHKIFLQPKSENQMQDSLYLWIDGETFLIHKILFWDKAGSEVSFKFKNIKVNTNLSEKKFNFTIPQGVEIIDLTEFKKE